MFHHASPATFDSKWACIYSTITYPVNWQWRFILINEGSASSSCNRKMNSSTSCQNRTHSEVRSWLDSESRRADCVCTPAGRGDKIGERHVALLDAPDVLDEQLVVALHFVGGLASDGAGDVVPAVGRVLVVLRQRVLEHLVLLCAPWRRVHWTGRHNSACYCSELTGMENGAATAVTYKPQRECWKGEDDSVVVVVDWSQLWNNTLKKPD